MVPYRWLFVPGLVLLALSTDVTAQAASAPRDPSVVITVNGDEMKQAEFDAAMARGARQRFYHGGVDEKKAAELRKDIADEFIRESLLRREAERRKIAPDLKDVEAKIAEYEKRYKDSEMWAANRERILPDLRAKMIDNSRRAKLEQTVRTVEAPTEQQLKKFYTDNPNLFTEPERIRVGLILLKVDPSSTKEVWAEALTEAERIRQKILGGSDFSELAKLHSSDESAQNGGDLGYLHQGMLAKDAQAVLDKMAAGNLSEPVELLQGYAIFKLLDRHPAELQPLTAVKERAQDLYKRHKGDERWQALVADLRRKADIWISPAITVPPPQK